MNPFLTITHTVQRKGRRPVVHGYFEEPYQGRMWTFCGVCPTRPHKSAGYWSHCGAVIDCKACMRTKRYRKPDLKLPHNPERF